MLLNQDICTFLAIIDGAMKPGVGLKVDRVML